MSKEENNIDKIYLLTPMQEGMLFHTISDDESNAYFTQLSYSTKGELNMDVFSDSLDVLSERHDIIRTAFVYGKTDKPIQVVLKNRKIVLTVIDASSKAEDDYALFLADYKQKDIDRGFDLINDPLVRMTIFKRSDTAYDFLWSYHHILFDGWCHTILIEEVGHIYDALSHNRKITLPPPVSFDTYVNWLGKKNMENSQDYWKNYLEGYDSLTQIPKVVTGKDKAPTALKRVLTFTKEHTAALEAIAKDRGVTLNEIFQAVWGLLLARYSNTNDVVYGNVVSGRPAEIEGMERCLGMFINTIPVRLTFSETDSFMELVNVIHEDYLDGLAHHYCSLADIQNDSLLKRDLIKHIIAFENYPLSLLEEEADKEFLNISNIDVFDQTNYDFDIDIVIGEEIEVTFYFDPSSYSTAYVENMSESFMHLAEQFMYNPEIKIGEVQLLTETHKKEIVYGLNPKATDLKNTEPIHVRFEAQALKYAQHTAIIHRDEEWSFEKLNETSNRIAHLLIEQGIQKGDFVGVSMERTPNLIASLLAIFKAGAVYIPLDTQNPIGRIIELIEDSKLSALIGTKSSLTPLGGGITKHSELKQIICIDDELTTKDLLVENSGIEVYSKDDLLHNYVENPTNLNTIEDWAYMLYTSGSTGKPKGAITRHNGAMNHILAEYKALCLEDGFRFLQSASIASDISVWQMLAPLLKGGTVVISDKEDVLDYEKIVTLMKENEVTIAEFVPSYLNGLVDYLMDLDTFNTILPSLQWMMMVGEEVPVKLVNNWLQLFPGCKVLNGYGPCEASDDITQFIIDSPLSASRTKVPIGKPIDNMNIFVLNSNEDLVPIGVAGEICVSGVGVGAGYFGEPEKTAIHFKPNPFSDTLGDVLYKTGDLGRWMPDGNLEFLGRLDRQVKIRGNRVELGEIEAFIKETELTKTTHIVAHKNGTAAASLLAFITLDTPSITPVLGADFLNNLDHKIDTLQQENPNLKGKVLELEHGLKAFSLNHSETSFVFDEIFTDQTYLQHGIQLAPGDVVFDVGANIGMFSMMVSTCFPGCKIYAFEPIPPTYEVMKGNATLYGSESEVITYKAGLSDKNQKVTFTHYPKNSMLSGRYGDKEADTGYTRNVLERQLIASETEKLEPGNVVIEDQINSIVEDMMYSENYECKLMRFSDVIKEQGITEVDLLKIDVERSELDVLAGIDAEDWNKIKQLVIEVHEDGTSLAFVKNLLEEKGYTCHSMQEELLINTNLHTIYAHKNKAHTEDVTSNEHQKITSELMRSCQEGLPGYMQPSEFCIVDEIPYNLSDKVDEKGLLALYDQQKRSQDGVTAKDQSCITKTQQQLKEIWEKILQRTDIGVQDNFFEKGGHSLLAMRVKAAIAKQLNINVDIRDLFTYPTLATLAECIDGKENAESIKEIIIQERPDRIPLSYAQESIWFIDQLQGSSEYHIPAVLQLKGNLNISVLHASLKEIVNRHEVLRSVIKSEDGKAYQEIIASEAWELTKVTHLISSTKAELDNYISACILDPFDLAESFKLRATLIEQPDNTYILVLVMHHIASDGWSESILVDELMALYAAMSSGQKAELLELPLQYVDYTLWQQNAHENFSTQIDYWKNQLSDVSVLELPTDFERPKTQSTEGASLECIIAPQLAQRIKELSSSQGTTLFMTLLTVFRVLLYRYTGQNDICIGTPIAGRTHQEFENLIGFFVNTLVIRSNVESDVKFEDFLQQVKETTLDAFKYQDTPFEKIVEATMKQRDLSRNPIFQVMFTLQNTPGLQEFVLDGLTIESVKPTTIQTHSDLHFIVEENSDKELVLEIEYRTDLFKEETISSMLVHYLELLDSVSKGVDQKVGLLKMLGDNEQHQLLDVFNASNVLIPKDQTVLDLFQKQAQLIPDAIAIAYEGEVLSYKELDEQSSRLAHYLKQQGVQQESIIPICLERSFEMIIGIFGILKAGGAYVPIDPNHPQERVDFILKDTAASCVLIQSKFSGRFEKTEEKIQSITVDTILPKLSESQLAGQLDEVTNDQLAYIIYTSGTTGMPKGVMIEHGALHSFVLSFNSLYPMNKEDKIAFKTNYGFDVSVHELFGWIIGGGTLQIIPEGVEKNAKELLNQIENYQITHLNLVPSLFSIVLEELKQVEATSLPSLKYFLLAGEALPVSLVNSYDQLKLAAKLENIYGPTEATIYSSYYSTDALEKSDKSVPIGRPVPNTSLYVLDSTGSLVPMGASGELCIGGNGLSRGYLNRPKLTQEKFINHPYLAGQRLYKTGDIARWRSDGILEFLGRMDDQVKLRGYRIELGEIESALDQCGGIKQSVVVARDGNNGEKQLVAYLISEEQIDIGKLRESLLENLPDYMIPKAYVTMDVFPMTDSGKIDKKALPAPNDDAYQRQEYVAPKSLVECRLAEIWQQLLGIDNVGVYDNFFELGGHSLLAIRLVALMQSEFEMVIHLKDVFNYATISEIAKYIEFFTTDTTEVEEEEEVSFL